MSRRFSSRVPYRGSMPGVISRDFFIKRSSDLHQDMRGWMLRNQLGDLNLQGSFGRNSAQHRVTSVGLRPDWRGLPIICRSCAQTRTPSAHSQANSWMIPVPQKVHLAFLVQFAFNVDSQDRISAMPGWMDSQEYDVSAKVEGDQQLTLGQMRPMLRRLLEQRFHFAAHHETKIVSGFWLVVAKSGPKLQPSKDDS